MGNCWGAKKVDHHRSASTTGISIPETGRSNNNSDGGGFSNSSAGKSVFSSSRTTTTTTTTTSSTSTSTSSGTIDDSFPNGQILPTPNLKIFSFAELKSATRNFKSDTVLGEGGFGTVYKGWIDDKNNSTSSSLSSKNTNGTVVAIKKLNSESMQGLEEWQSEVNFLGRLSHPNLVKLLGYCLEDKELLLVYEFMQKGSLENHLFRRSSAVQPLQWDIRIKIAIGAARGLEFLHSSEKQIIYRDFKASNILLDGIYNPKLSDFGLAKNGPLGSASHLTTRIMGTYGYAAPEYMATGHLYVKSDVYGFGVVLLEMLTGQRAVDMNRPSDQHNLVDWLKPSLSDRRKLVRVMDPRLEGKYPSKAALQAAELTLKCLGSEPRVRPSMKEVLETLERIQAIKGGSRGSQTRPTNNKGHRKRHGHHHAPRQSPLHPNYNNTAAANVYHPSSIAKSL